MWFANGVRTCYDYDGESLRFVMIENGKRTQFITNGWENLAELDEDGKVVKRVIRGMGIAASEDFDGQPGEGGAYHYYHGNERSDVELITDENGSVANRYSYDAFGTITDSEETIANRYTYNGEAYDQITGQYYLRKRFYNPAVCRFTQEDEYRGDGLNLYAFCANNPVTYVDPSGYANEKCITGSNSSSESESAEDHPKMTGSQETDGTTVCYGEFEGGSESRNIGTPNSGQGFSPNGYNPQPEERTLDGYVKNHASPEISLHTDSAGFNNNNGNVGGDFKRFGAESHGGVSPHVHQPQRNVAPNGNIYGTVGTKTSNGGVTSPSKKDVKQLYEYLTNGKYH